jgi:hypothetical protein
MTNDAFLSVACRLLGELLVHHEQQQPACTWEATTSLHWQSSSLVAWQKCQSFRNNQLSASDICKQQVRMVTNQSSTARWCCL